MCSVLVSYLNVARFLHLPSNFYHAVIHKTCSHIVALPSNHINQLKKVNAFIAPLVVLKSMEDWCLAIGFR